MCAPEDDQNGTFDQFEAVTYLGRIETISVDAPIGSSDCEIPGIFFPINYGFLRGTLSGDGEPFEVYLLGVDEPVKKYTGRIVGFIDRKDDVEGRLVMAPIGMTFTQNEIAEQVHFREQYHDISIVALEEKSCGAIVFRRDAGKLSILCLYQSRSHTYSVPKGHMEAFESEEETAVREIFEETGLTAKILPGFRETIGYGIGGGRHKTVVLFLAEYTGDVHLDAAEIADARWLPIGEAAKILPDGYAPILEKLQTELG